MHVENLNPSRRVTYVYVFNTTPLRTMKENVVKKLVYFRTKNSKISDIFSSRFGLPGGLKAHSSYWVEACIRYINAKPWNTSCLIYRVLATISHWSTTYIGSLLLIAIIIKCTFIERKIDRSSISRQRWDSCLRFLRFFSNICIITYVPVDWIVKACYTL